MNKPLLVAFLGFPGSGKTYFARQLAPQLQAVTLNSDAMRLAVFGSLEQIEKIRHSSSSFRLNTEVFGAMDYAARQALLAGYSVVYDAQQSKRKNRRGIEKIAAESGAIPVLVWVKTSRDVAMKRGQERAAADDSHQYDAGKMAYLIDRFASANDLPEPDENTIEISGEISFDEQYAVFAEAVSRLT